MLEYVNSPDGRALYLDAHVSHSILDNSVRSLPVSVVNTGTLFCPIYAEKGVDGVVKYFSGISGYEQLIEEYGEPNISRFGLPYTAVTAHMLRGGNVVTLLCKPEDAINAGFIVYLQIETKNEDQSSIEKTLGWIKTDGSGFVEDPYADTEAGLPRPTVQHIVHKIYTSRISFVSKEIKNVRNIDDLTLIVQADFETEYQKKVPGSKRLFPLIYGLYNGKGSYGNNYEFITKKGPMKISGGRPTYETFIRDSRLSKTLAGTQQVVTLNNDIYDGVPLYIEGQYKPYTAGDKFSIRAIDEISMNQLGKIIYDLFDRTKLFTSGATLGGTQALALEERVRVLKELFVKPKDPNYTALQYLNIADMSDLGAIFNVQNIGRIKFTGGTDGVLANEEKFDWEKSFTITQGNTTKTSPVYVEMFKKAFTGQYTREIFSGYANPANYIIDMGFPNAVKEAIIGFSEKRDDMQVVFNAPVSCKTETEAINWKMKFNYFNRNYLYCPGNFEYLDNISNRTTRVPMSFALMNNILNHYQNGYDKSLAGTINDGLITDIQPNTYRALGDMSLDSNDKLLRAGFVTCKHYRNGMLYLNSQKTNYKLQEISSLQEFHNNSIINQILKTLYILLQDDLHRLTSAEELAVIQAHVKDALAIFEPKVEKLIYKASFKNPFDKSYGLVTHQISIVFYNTIKYHHIAIEALPLES